MNAVCPVHFGSQPATEDMLKDLLFVLHISFPLQYSLDDRQDAGALIEHHRIESLATELGACAELRFDDGICTFIQPSPLPQLVMQDVGMTADAFSIKAIQYHSRALREGLDLPRTW